jgi:hypothetical protein
VRRSYVDLKYTQEKSKLPTRRNPNKPSTLKP